MWDDEPVFVHLLLRSSLLPFPVLSPPPRTLHFTFAYHSYPSKCAFIISVELQHYLITNVLIGGQSIQAKTEGGAEEIG